MLSRQICDFLSDGDQKFPGFLPRVRWPGAYVKKIAKIIFNFHKKSLEMLLGHFKSAIIFSKTNASIEMHSTGEVQFIARLLCPLAKFLTQRNKRLRFQSMPERVNICLTFSTPPEGFVTSMRTTQNLSVHREINAAYRIRSRTSP